MATKTTTARSDSSTSDAAKAAASDYEALKQDIAQLRNDLQSLANNSSKYVKGRSTAEFDKNLERGREYAEKATAQAESTRDYLETKVRENPMAAVGLAFGTGILLAALRRK